MLKQVVQNCSDEQGILNLTRMKQFTDMVMMQEALHAMIAKYSEKPPADDGFSKKIHSFLVLRPREIIIGQSSQTEMLENMTQRLIKLMKTTEENQRLLM